MNILDLLKSMIPAEVIDGANVEDLISAVDLDIAFTPVIEHAVSEERLMRDVPETTRVEKWDDGYAIVRPREHDFTRLSEESVKRMRARYLLVRGFYWKRLNVMPYDMQCRVRSIYFRDGTWTPKPGTPLADLMGLIGEHGGSIAIADPDDESEADHADQ